MTPLELKIGQVVWILLSLICTIISILLTQWWRKILPGHYWKGWKTIFWFSLFPIGFCFIVGGIGTAFLGHLTTWQFGLLTFYNALSLGFSLWWPLGLIVSTGAVIEAIASNREERIVTASFIISLFFSSGLTAYYASWAHRWMQTDDPVYAGALLNLFLDVCTIWVLRPTFVGRFLRLVDKPISDPFQETRF